MNKKISQALFHNGLTPFIQGLSFRADLPKEGSDIFTAGFAGLGNTVLWQFSKGTVSNSAARIPIDNNSDKTAAPYIRHTAQVQKFINTSLNNEPADERNLISETANDFIDGLGGGAAYNHLSNA